MLVDKAQLRQLLATIPLCVKIRCEFVKIERDAMGLVGLGSYLAGFTFENTPSSVKS